MAEKNADRFISLDVLRGITVVGMILVNAQGVGGVYPFLSHSSWNGCTPADLVYPFFLFIVGAAIRFTFKKSNYSLTSEVAIKVIKRSFWIFLIGFLLNTFPFTGDPHYWRIPGVLQRIALVYMTATFLILWLKSFQKILLLTVFILLGYWALLAATGSTLEENIVGVVDRFLFGEAHLYTGYGTCFDPEGIVSTLPAIANALLGYLTAMLLTAENKQQSFPYRTAAAGALCILLAWVWNTVFPFNKPLWSSSFALYTSGWAAVIWAFMFWVIDVQKIKGWTGIFLVFGTNALFTYILSDLLIILDSMRTFTYQGASYRISSWMDTFYFSPLTLSPMRSLLWGITIVTICWAITYPLYRKRIFIKL